MDYSSTERSARTPSTGTGSIAPSTAGPLDTRTVGSKAPSWDIYYLGQSARTSVAVGRNAGAATSLATIASSAYGSGLSDDPEPSFKGREATFDVRVGVAGAEKRHGEVCHYQPGGSGDSNAVTHHVPDRLNEKHSPSLPAGGIGADPSAKTIKTGETRAGAGTAAEGVRGPGLENNPRNGMPVEHEIEGNSASTRIARFISRLPLTKLKIVIGETSF